MRDVAADKPEDRHWSTGWVESPVGRIPRVSTDLTPADALGAWRVRWGIGRERYLVQPGVYAVGDPTPRSDVFVTANYKLTFDRIRGVLGGRDGWLLVLDTRGINVWCAAGKGTFGTEELVARIRETRLPELVEHHRLILPQLGAVGVSAHKVTAETGFKVTYGPVYAKDLPAYLDAGRQVTPEMRQAGFTFVDRLILTPVELVTTFKPIFLTALVITILSGLNLDGWSTARMLASAPRILVSLVTAWLCGGFLVPILLPWLPGRAFSLKGAAAGLAAGLILCALACGPVWPAMELAAWLLAIASISSFIAMNFTGATPFTSPSGVRKEMKRWVPIQLAAAILAAGLWIADKILHS